MDINEGINQEGAKRAAGLPPTSKKGAVNINASSKEAGRNYANRVNSQAKKRMASYHQNIKVKDCLDAVNRYLFEGLPLGLRSKLIERIGYYRGNAMGYWDYNLDRYFLLPYSLTAEGEQSIDFYGQYTMIKPNAFNGKSTDNRNAKTGANIETAAQKTANEAYRSILEDKNSKPEEKKAAADKMGPTVYLGAIKRIPVYDREELEALLTSKGEEWCRKNLCVIYRDYTQQLSENNIPRSVTQEAFIDFQAECLPMMRTMMLKACMPKLVKGDEGVVESLIEELNTIEASIIEGKTMIPVTAFQDLQEIDSQNSGQVIEAMMKCYEGINNIRKSFLGIPNDGAFKKNAHTLQDEQDQSEQANDTTLDDGLESRQEWCDLMNRLFGLKITVRPKTATDKKDTEEEEEEIEEEPQGEGGEK